MTLPKTARELLHLKGQRPQVWITAYDFTQAELAQSAAVDAILVGDSLGMTMLGYSTTLPVTVDDMVYHSRVVRRAASDTLLIVDMPFLSYRDPATALVNAGRIMQEAAADAVKLEGGARIIPVVEHLVAEGIPVIGHLGLTPQSVHRMGGYRVQARTADAVHTLVEDARQLAAAGISALVLEGIPDRVAALVTHTVTVPTIGIGAGSATDGQVLVFHDCVGLSARTPKFVTPFAHGREALLQGIRSYREAVIGGTFPDAQHSYHITDEEWDHFVRQHPS